MSLPSHWPEKTYRCARRVKTAPTYNTSSSRRSAGGGRLGRCPRCSTGCPNVREGEHTVFFCGVVDATGTKTMSFGFGTPSGWPVYRKDGHLPLPFCFSPRPFHRDARKHSGNVQRNGRGEKQKGNIGRRGFYKQVTPNGVRRSLKRHQSLIPRLRDGRREAGHGGRESNGQTRARAVGRARPGTIGRRFNIG